MGETLDSLTSSTSLTWLGVESEREREKKTLERPYKGRTRLTVHDPSKRGIVLNNENRKSYFLTESVGFEGV